MRMIQRDMCTFHKGTIILLSGWRLDTQVKYINKQTASHGATILWSTKLKTCTWDRSANMPWDLWHSSKVIHISTGWIYQELCVELRIARTFKLARKASLSPLNFCEAFVILKTTNKWDGAMMALDTLGLYSKENCECHQSQLWHWIPCSYFDQ